MGKPTSAALPTERAPGTSLARGEVLADATTGSRFRITGFIGKGGMRRIPIVWSLEIVPDVSLDPGPAQWNRPGMRLTSSGTQGGTLAYMARELLDESSPVDAAADIWSAGVVLYELLTHRQPFAAARWARAGQLRRFASIV